MNLPCCVQPSLHALVSNLRYGQARAQLSNPLKITGELYHAYMDDLATENVKKSEQSHPNSMARLM